VHRFYAPDFTADREVQLPVEEAQHLSRVLRLKPGDAVAVFDGKGLEALARIETADARGATVRVTGPREPAAEPKIALTLGQALLKSDGMDRVIRDAVMLGVAAVQPLVTQRTEVPRAALRTGVRQGRWDRTVISSVKQCGRAVVPPVLETVDFRQLLAGTSGRTRLMFVEPGNAAANVKDLQALEAHRPSDAMILIGPEGGWDPQEVDQAANAGVTLVALGSRTLRADAAGAVAIAVLQYIWNDL
jgi:16S rRNA (uracil1498-N3)-methyltransferase